MELTVEVGRANFRWKRLSLMVMVGSRTPNRQQRSYAGNSVAMNDRTNVFLVAGSCFFSRNQLPRGAWIGAQGVLEGGGGDSWMGARECLGRER